MIFRIVAPYFWTAKLPKAAYVLKIAWTYYFFYQFYATLFVYSPLSKKLGSFVERIKIMVMRDIFCFLMLISIVFFSTLVAIKSLLYPDLNQSWDVAKNILGWSWSTLVTNNLDNVAETKECKKFAYTEFIQSCRGIGGYGDPWCPSQGIAANVTLFQYLILLKVLAWSILIALFARSSKHLDNKADQEWKTRLYTLSVDLNVRPFLPPPFTLLFFFCFGLQHVTGCISGLFAHFPHSSTDHPDACSSQSAFYTSSAVYRNPSIPPTKMEVQRGFWGSLAINIWKQNYQRMQDQKAGLQTWSDKRLSEKFQLLVISNNFDQCNRKARQSWQTVPDDEHKRLKVTGNRAWTYLTPDYCPPHYSQTTEEFAPDIKKNVQQNVSEVAKSWRQYKLNWHIANHPNKQRLLSATGLPLNPFGRTGLMGRGTYAKYGSNMIFFYVIFAKFNHKLMVLLNSKNELPKKWKHGALRADEFLSEILSKLRVPDADIQRFAIRSHMPIGQVENNIAHVCISPLSSPEDTDNAWTESDVWTIFLDKATVLNVDGFLWRPAENTGLPEGHEEFVRRSADLFKISIQ